jgi:hypothetical protein
MHRTRPYARQQLNGSYRWVDAPCDKEVLLAHLAGTQTIALASSDARGWCRWVCLDCDMWDEQSLPQLVQVAATLAERRLPGLVEASRRGGHLWLFLDGLIPAVEARYVVLTALDELQASGTMVPPLEMYPDTRAPYSVGQAVRLPLGIHRRTGRRYPLLDRSGRPMQAASLAESLRYVLATPRVSAEEVRRRWAAFVAGHSPRVLEVMQGSGGARALTSASSTRLPAGGGGDRGQQEASRASEFLRTIGALGIGTRSAVIRWVDTHVSPIGLLDELVPSTELHRLGQGYLGWCPFHDDRAPDVDGGPGTPSFYVVDNQRYGWSWRCLSTHCPHSAGRMRHTFRLFQEVLGLDVVEAIQAACVRWPEAAQAT